MKILLKNQEIFSLKLLKKNVSTTIRLLEEPNYGFNFNVSDSGPVINVKAFIQKVDKRDFMDNLEIHEISWRKLKDHYSHKKTHYATDKFIIPTIMLKSIARIPTFLK